MIKPNIKIEFLDESCIFKSSPKMRTRNLYKALHMTPSKIIIVSGLGLDQPILKDIEHFHK